MCLRSEVLRRALRFHHEILNGKCMETVTQTMPVLLALLSLAGILLVSNIPMFSPDALLCSNDTEEEGRGCSVWGQTLLRVLVWAGFLTGHVRLGAKK